MTKVNSTFSGEYIVPIEYWDLDVPQTGDGVSSLPVGVVVEGAQSGGRGVNACGYGDRRDAESREMSLTVCVEVERRYEVQRHLSDP